MKFILTQISALLGGTVEGDANAERKEPKKEFDLLIDIQEKLRKGKGKGYIPASRGPLRQGLDAGRMYIWGNRRFR